MEDQPAANANYGASLAISNTRLQAGFEVTFTVTPINVPAVNIVKYPYI
ncbi:MAG: hypothetical protein HUJ51_02585 [Eggerthellaceae bacterium]|nr:hypothetical protein [Eggerthellaceae bacterium]